MGIVFIFNNITVHWVRLSSVRVYNCSTSENPTDWETLRRSIEDTARSYPSANAVWYPQFMFARSRFTYKILEFVYQTLPLHLAELIKLCFYNTNKTNSMSLSRLSGRLSAMSGALEYFATREFSFPARNVRRLRARLSHPDRALYNLDPNTIEWRVALQNFVIGVRRHVLMEKDDTIPAARKRLRRMYILHRGLTILIPVLMSTYLLTRRRGEVSLLRSITKQAIWFYRNAQKPSKFLLFHGETSDLNR
ncbi:hypothetical protein evm_012299 [Chilo suppressalis]|nr:hypothetical protein evm_012299 [Chilo suppressalis]